MQRRCNVTTGGLVRKGVQVVATEVDDATLVVHARLGDALAFEALVRRHAGPLLGHAPLKYAVAGGVVSTWP